MSSLGVGIVSAGMAKKEIMDGASSEGNAQV